MRGKIMFLGGLAAGFVLGARAGREKYEELVIQGRKVLDHPTVQEAAGVAQAQANRLYQEGKDKLEHSKLGEKLHSNGKHGLTPADDTYAGTPATAGSKAGGSSSSATSSTSATPRKPTGTNGSTL
ncbi:MULTISPECIES: hypothetical protein [unclassified Micromonospora]|uniref:hypothetical protein n=1 Tax=unclassified Micromonospora TaxID=2617518 RepID=UPI001033D4D7|nr:MULTISPECIES: hypothetical protein [unclassified Micromonospora]QKW15819.1 hypothetical protein HUT12_25730 [Verrucosispora sp. NA02020]TBL34086.1 hypothetical protein EYA84_16275 [Verrucosispora sp. SN26_14.1]